MRVGFTGTRDGMTDEQHRKFIVRVQRSGVTEFHHGCCIGADADAHDVVSSADDLGFPRPRVVAHPPTDKRMVSDLALMFVDEKREPADYLTRNRAIVDATDTLFACPKGPEELRSGTWSTIRYARKQGRPVVIFWPDGTVEG